MACNNAARVSLGVPLGTRPLFYNSAMADVRDLLILNDHHEWVSGVYTRVGEPQVRVALDNPAYVEWAANHKVHLEHGPASPLVCLLVWAAVEKPWGTWDDVVCSTHAPEMGACVQLKYTIDKYGCTGKYTSMTYKDHSGQVQHIYIKQ